GRGGGRRRRRRRRRAGRWSSSDRRQRRADGQHILDDGARRVGTDLRGAVAQRGGGVVVHFHEESVRAGGRRGARQRPRELRRPAGLLPFTARLLHGVRDVVDDGRAEAANDGKG